MGYFLSIVELLVRNLLVRRFSGGYFGPGKGHFWNGRYSYYDSENNQDESNFHM